MTPPGSALEVQPHKIMTGDEARAYAEELAESKMISPHFRGSIPNVLYAMELGRVYGIEPATVLQNIHVFPDGKGNLKAATSAHLMVTLARRAGHIVTTSANPKGATCTITRGDSLIGRMMKGGVTPDELAHYGDILKTLKELEVDPKEMGVSQVRWTTEMAIRADLMGKDNWVKYPHAMFASAAKRDCVRIAAEEVLIQLADRSAYAMDRFGPLSADGQPVQVTWTHTADELGASVTDDGEVVELTDRERHEAQRAVQQDPTPPARETIVVASDAEERKEADRQAAAADIAAQAGSDPSQAGWHQKAEPKTPKPDPNAAVRNFVTSKSPADIAIWGRQTLLDDSMPNDTRDQRISLVMGLLCENCDIDKTVAVVSEFSDLDGLDSSQKVTLIGALHKAAKARNLLQQDVNGDGKKFNDVVVEIVRPLMADASGS